MPLPPLPTKRAALLTVDAYDAPARSTSTPRKKGPVARAEHAPVERPLAREQDDKLARAAEAHPAAFAEKPALTGRPERAELPEPTPAEGPARLADNIASATAVKPKKRKTPGPAKLFVLDTNVLLHDPMCLYRFEEHDIFLPMIVLEELDGHKKGMTEVARNARQTSRSLDALAGTNGADIGDGLRLDSTEIGRAHV